MDDTLSNESPEQPADESGSRAPICSAFGELVVWEEEGGYCTPYLALNTDAGEVSFEDLLLNLFPEMEMDGGKKGHRIKVSIEILEQNVKAHESSEQSTKK